MAMKGLSKAYYLKPVKIIRDFVHGYVNLTKFDLELIDTVPFQRLSDVRQLTCQHVYPGARHTRFEHSLGVLELMRGSIKYLNRNRFLGEEPYSEPIFHSAGDKPEAEGRSRDGARREPLIDASLEFNASVAALLHDVGHCPFSHMGETQFDKAAVRNALVESVSSHTQLKDRADLIKILREREKIGAVHEQLSCIVILQKYSDVLLNLTRQAEEGEESCEIEVDFELIIRSILGIEYNVDTTDEFQKNRLKNVIVRLLNSKIFDVDKLDYIMRDAYLTGIGTPSIDTQRLFRNMYLDDKYCLIFTSKATPALQNMIEARDGLYLYVYNHHAVVYSDFLNTYISRRLSHNAKAFYKTVYPTMSDAELDEELEISQISELGLVPKSYLFSVGAVVEQNHSDSAWLSLLNIIHINYNEITQGRDEAAAKDEIKQRIKGILTGCHQIPVVRGDKITIHQPVKELPSQDEAMLTERIYGAQQLVHQFLTRYYLKPWWKTVFEFTNFMRHHFQDDRVRRLAGKYICDGGDYGLKADEMRSQIAKHVAYITQQLEKDGTGKELGLIESLHDGDFFVVQRSTNFFSPNTIEGLEIALKSNEILGAPMDVSRQMNEYYLKTLTNIIPQKNYSSIYAKEGFYVFSKLPHIGPANKKTDERRRFEKHYELLEEIFVFVVKKLISDGEQKFVEAFQKDPCEEKEQRSKEYAYRGFKKIKQWG